MLGAEVWWFKHSKMPTLPSVPLAVWTDIASLVDGVNFYFLFFCLSHKLLQCWNLLQNSFSSFNEVLLYLTRGFSLGAVCYCRSIGCLCTCISIIVVLVDPFSFDTGERFENFQFAIRRGESKLGRSTSSTEGSTCSLTHVKPSCFFASFFGSHGVYVCWRGRGVYSFE